MAEMADANKRRWETFLLTHTGEEIASQLRNDQAAEKSKRLPSPLALYMPSATSDLALSVAKYLIPGDFPRSVRNLVYDGVIQGLKGSLSQMKHSSAWKDPEKRSVKDYQHPKPTRDQYVAALAVLEFLVAEEDIPEIKPEVSIKHLRNTLHRHLQKPGSVLPSPERTIYSESETDAKRFRKCYICQMKLLDSHPQYSSLCKPCGRFNLAESNLSLPGNLNLRGKTALVTGGRVNLGYHTTLRLLRCGAKVIVSTRYPFDAESRFRTERDFLTFEDNLRIVGADFRSARDVFQLVEVVKDQIQNWAAEAGCAKLDILVNNAAQTLTDPIEVERNAITIENQLRLQNTNTPLVKNIERYFPRVRGGVQLSGLSSHITPVSKDSLTCHSALESERLEVEASENFKRAPYLSMDHKTISASKGQELSTYAQDPLVLKSSWMQSLDEIPYEDVISAHSVNTFVPLILIRELLPVMGAIASDTPLSASSFRPTLAHIINVSSREGIFESSSESSSKAGHHVHTNMSKAGLNMITETEAAKCWKNRRVAMNSVDPGYMSAAPEVVATLQKKYGKGPGGSCPIGWEDGAGRVLWPVAVTWGEENRGDAVWGRFLKHFGEVEVDVGLGR